MTLPASPETQAEINGLLTEFARLSRNGEFQKMVDYSSDDCLSFFGDSPILRGKDSMYFMFETFHKVRTDHGRILLREDSSVFKPEGLLVDNINNPTVAIQWGILTQTTPTLGINGDDLVYSSKFLFVWKPVGNTWKVSFRSISLTAPASPELQKLLADVRKEAAAIAAVKQTA